MGHIHERYLSSCCIWTLVVIFLCCWRTALGDPRTTLVLEICRDTKAALPNDWANNFVSAMDNLSSSIAENGYGKTSFGQGSITWFGVAQCMEDLDSVDCELCYSEVRSLLPKCYPYVGGRLYLEGCFARCENYSFFDQVVDLQDTSNCSSGNHSSNPLVFGEVVKDVVTNVTVAAPKNKGFAVGSASQSETIAYALAQCWEISNESLCSSCLNAAAASIVNCVPATQGQALFAGCYIRYSTYLFWNLYETKTNSTGKHKIISIVLGSLLGGLMVIVGILAWKRRVLWTKARPTPFSNLYGIGLPVAISQSSLNFSYEELKRATENFNLSKKLGQGSFGIVYKATLSDGNEVAVKRLFLNTRQRVDQFFNEVELISRVRHKNLVKLLGCSVDGPESLLVYEYYFNRSLDLFIFGTTRNKHLAWQQRIDIIQGVAEGMSYLHEESETRIIHRDIKASNILLDDQFKPKVTDFGLARVFSEDKTHLTTGIAGTLGYMAPEYIVHGHLTEKADVYAYGMLVLEIVTGQRCNGSIGSHTGHLLLGKVWNHYKANTMENIIDERIHEDNARDEILHVMKIGLSCTQANPRDRPTMSRVVKLLRSRKHDSELILSEPLYFDVEALEGTEEGEVSSLLSTNSGNRQSLSPQSHISSR